MADSLVSRVGRIVSGSVNALVDNLENAAPGAVMAEAIREVDSAIDEVRRELNKVAAQKHLATKRLAEVNREHEELAEKISVAMNQDRDDLARSAIARQIDLEAQVPVVERAVSDAGEEERELRSYVEALLAKRREMEARLQELRATKAASGGSGGDEASGSGSKAEDRVARASAAFERSYAGASGIASAGDATSPQDASRLAELDKLARDHRIEERLAALKSAG